MMTPSEARRRAEIYDGQIKWAASVGEYHVYLNGWNREQRERMGYYTDDLEDAVLTLGAMRRRHDVC